jgi:hypothetical protein
MMKWQKSLGRNLPPLPCRDRCAFLLPKCSSLPGRCHTHATLHFCSVQSTSGGGGQGPEKQWNQHRAQINPPPSSLHSEHEQNHVRRHYSAGLSEPGICCKVEWSCRENEIAAAAAALIRIDAAEQVARDASRC